MLTEPTVSSISQATEAKLRVIGLEQRLEMVLESPFRRCSYMGSL